jgi:hypothetical protein
METQSGKEGPRKEEVAPRCSICGTMMGADHTTAWNPESRLFEHVCWECAKTLEDEELDDAQDLA